MPPKKKAANGYKFAEPLPKGIILEDISKKKWKLGPSIGKGGFGEIYSAQEESSRGELYPYVIKIEPHANGPLFVEINFYLRHAKPSYIEEFKKEKGLKTFGMPVYYGSGSIEYKGEKYRFLVMDKFSTDLYKLYIDNNKVFPIDTVFKLGLQILAVVEYIHLRGYVHADIKAANILLGATKQTRDKQVYLVDFGLATKYTMEKEFKPNPKKAHDGTIEFLSRDAHQGVQTRRGDLEILAYNLIQWLGCKLPWEPNLNDPKVVQKSKEETMANVPKMIKASFGSKAPPKAIVDFLNYLKTLNFNTEPDYKKIIDIFTSGVKEGGGSIGTPLQFSGSKTPLKRNRTPLPNSRNKKTKSNKDEESVEVSSDADVTPKPKKMSRAKNNLNVAEEDDNVKMETPHSSDDEEPSNFITIRRKPRNLKKVKSLEDLSNNFHLDGYNDAMKEIKLKKINNGISEARNRGRLPNSKHKSTKLDNEDIRDDNDKTPKSKTKKRAQKDLVYNDLHDDIESANNSENEEINSLATEKKELKNKTANRRGKLNRKLSKSVDDLSNAHGFQGYTAAMKEIMLKKFKDGGRKKRAYLTPNTQLTRSLNEDDMVGFTEEMKAIALKKKSRENIRKKTTSTVPIATTSRASGRRGLVKSNSKRMQKKVPVTHGEGLSYSDDSVSE